MHNMSLLGQVKINKIFINNVNKIIKLLNYLKTDFKEIKLLFSFKVIFPWYNSIKDEIPWINYKAKKWLDSYLKPNMKVFEYGSGGSTFFFHKHTNFLVSVEHNRFWYQKMVRYSIKQNIVLKNYFLVEPQESLNTNKEFNYKSDKIFYANMSFRNYVKTIDNYPQNYFDIVFIDGRARNACVKRSLDIVKQNGIIILDDSNKESYEQSKKLLKKYNRIDFYGLGPYRTYPWQTSIWFIND